MESYFQNLKNAIIKQTELLPKGKIAETIKTDDIFTNLVIHHGKKRRREQIQRPEEYHPDRKMLTEMKQCSEIFVDEDEKDTTVKRILLSGEPGVGKTLFSQKLLRDLATNSTSIPDIKFTYLITFRQLNKLPKEETLSLRELLNRCPLLNEGAMIDETVSLMEYIIQHPKQFLVVLDGFDEYKERKKIVGDFESQFPNDGKAKMPVAALVSKLIRKKILSDSVIMLTSRPGEANDLDQTFDFDRYVEISGFSESQVIEYVKKYFSTKPEEVKNLALSKVKESAHYISFGRVPFRCLLMCVFIEWKIKKNDNSCPLTLTEFYFQVIQCIETNYNRALLSLDDKAASLAVDKTLDNFSKLAALLTEQKRFSFTLQDLENLKLSENELLYIKSSNLIFCYPVSSNNLPFQKPICEYSFTHFTIQEFFVAWYLAKKGVMAVQESTEMVYTFMSGLLGLNDNNELMVELLECLGKHIENTLFNDRLRLVSLRCLHEFGQDKRLTRQELNTNRDYRYWDSVGWIGLRGVTDTDWDAIAMLLESTATSISPPHILFISGSQITITGIKRLMSSLSTNCSITRLELVYCNLYDEHVKCLCKDLQKTKITQLNLQCNKITDGGVDDIMVHLHSNLTVLNLSDNNISAECKEKTIQFCSDKYPGLWLGIE